MNRLRLDELPPLEKPGVFRVVVESPRGSTVKLKLDGEYGVITVSRPLPVGLVYPYDWGFIPGTRAPDGDPLDAMVLWESSTFPGVVILCRALGVVQVEQDSAGSTRRRERNDRIVAVPVGAKRQAELQEHGDLPARVRAELEKFFLDVTAFEEKNATILGWKGARAAQKCIRSSVRSKRAPE